MVDPPASNRVSDVPFHSFTAPSLYPTPSQAALQVQFVGKKIGDAQAPALIIDAAVVRRNCSLMLDAAHRLGVDFRAHVKTHKTTEVTKLQMGEGSKSIKLVASTVSEVEHLLPWLLEFKAQGRDVNVCRTFATQATVANDDRSSMACPYRRLPSLGSQQLFAH